MQNSEPYSSDLQKHLPKPPTQFPFSDRILEENKRLNKAGQQQPSQSFTSRQSDDNSSIRLASRFQEAISQVENNLNFGAAKQPNDMDNSIPGHSIDVQPTIQL